MAAPVRVTQHPLWATQNQLVNTLDSLPPNFLAEQGSVIERARATLALLTERLEDVAAEVVSDGALANGHSWTQAMLSELQTAQAQGTPHLLATGNNFYANLEALSQNLHQFPVSHPSGSIASLADEAQRRLEAIQATSIQHEAAARASMDQQQEMYREAQEAKAQGLKRLEEQETAAGRLLAALGAEGTASGYAKTASSEKAQADFWRWVTIAAGAVTAVLAVALFLGIRDQGIAATATRAAVTLPVVLLAVYAGRQSSGHRQQEREAKRLELAFGSVDAYLADLDSGNRSELKALLSTRLFGGQGGPADGTGDYPSSADLAALLSEAIKRIRQP